jgi:hypothetical protein
MSASSYGALLDAVRGVHWQARRAVANAASGSHQSRQRGTSAEFTEYRLYRQGDDPRRIDWRLLGRSDRAYIRLATDRAILPTTIVLDASASMAFPVATREKWRLRAGDCDRDSRRWCTRTAIPSASPCVDGDGTHAQRAAPDALAASSE